MITKRNRGRSRNGPRRRCPTAVASRRIFPPFLLCLLLAPALAGCAQGGRDGTPGDAGGPSATLVRAPDRMHLGEEARIEWQVTGARPGDPYRTGIHFGPDSTANRSTDSLGLQDFPGSSPHRMGDGPGVFQVRVSPTEAGRIHYRLHLERHNGFLWSEEFVLDVQRPEHPVAILDAHRLPPAAWVGQETGVPWRFASPPGAEVASVEVVASYPNREVTVGREEGPAGPGWQTVPARLPSATQSVPVHVRAELVDGRVIASEPQGLHVVHQNGSLGQMASGSLASPAGMYFPLAWRLDGVRDPDHHDLHLGMHGHGAGLDQPESLYDRAMPRWDDERQVHWTALNVSQPGFLIARIHTTVEGIDTWSRSYVVEIYPPDRA